MVFGISPGRNHDSIYWNSSTILNFDDARLAVADEPSSLGGEHLRAELLRLVARPEMSTASQMCRWFTVQDACIYIPNLKSNCACIANIIDLTASYQ